MVIQLITIITILILLREFGRISPAFAGPPFPTVASRWLPRVNPRSTNHTRRNEKKRRKEEKNLYTLRREQKPEIYDNVVIYLYAFIMYTAGRMYARTYTVC